MWRKATHPTSQALLANLTGDRSPKLHHLLCLCWYDKDQVESHNKYVKSLKGIPIFPMFVNLDTICTEDSEDDGLVFSAQTVEDNQIPGWTNIHLVWHCPWWLSWSKRHTCLLRRSIWRQPPLTLLQHKKAASHHSCSLDNVGDKCFVLSLTARHVSEKVRDHRQSIMHVNSKLFGVNP